MTREKRLTRDRTRRGLESKRKARLRRRGMSPQWKPSRQGWSWKAFQARAQQLKDLPLKGVKADLRNTLPKTPTQKKRGFFARIFRRPGS